MKFVSKAERGWLGSNWGKASGLVGLRPHHDAGRTKCECILREAPPIGPGHVAELSQEQSA